MATQRKEKEYPPPARPSHVTPTIFRYALGRTTKQIQCLGAMVKAGPPVQGGGGNSGCKNKCPLCRIEFSEADVVGGAELEKAGGNAKQLEQERGGEGGAAGGLASAAVSAAAAGAAGVEEEGGKGVKVPPPKVAALLQRWETGVVGVVGRLWRFWGLVVMVMIGRCVFRGLFFFLCHGLIESYGIYRTTDW